MDTADLGPTYMHEHIFVLTAHVQQNYPVPPLTLHGDQLLVGGGEVFGGEVGDAQQSQVTEGN